MCLGTYSLYSFLGYEVALRKNSEMIDFKKLSEMRKQQQKEKNVFAAKLVNCTTLIELNGIKSTCKLCSLCKDRTTIVNGVGNPEADLMFIGEAPGVSEDKQGIPFVGRAGQLLTYWIEAMGLSRDEVFITNLTSCRPENNRVPWPIDVHECSLWLMKEIELVKPKILCTVGGTATNAFGITVSISLARGQKYFTKEDYSIFPIYHPAYILRQTGREQDVWKDLFNLRVGLEIATRK